MFVVARCSSVLAEGTKNPNQMQEACTLHCTLHTENIHIEIYGTNINNMIQPREEEKKINLWRTLLFGFWLAKKLSAANNASAVVSAQSWIHGMYRSHSSQTHDRIQIHRVYLKMNECLFVVSGGNLYKA